MVDLRILANKLKVITENFVLAVVGDLYLQNILVIVERNLFRNLKGQHRLKLVLFCLVSRHFSPDKIDFCLLGLQLIGVHVIVGTEEFVELFCEVF